MSTRSDPGALAAGYRQLTDAISRHYAATPAPPPPPEPVDRPSWAVDGYQPLDDTTINLATRQARAGVLTSLALEAGFASRKAASDARKTAREGGTPDRHDNHNETETTS